MRKLINLVVLYVLLSPLTVFALGLGEITLDSSLNQPLKASIALLSTDDMQPTEIIATLASDREFQRAGIERFFYLNAIRFQTVALPSGGMQIQLSTRDPIKEPFVNFLVELNWPAGKIVREYTLLLDPPIFDEEQRAAPSQPAQTEAPRPSRRPSQPEPSGFVEPEITTERTVPVIDDFDDGGAVAPGSHRVGANETAWSIAQQYRGNASVYQTIVAIYEANPQAFDGDINIMKRDAELRIPSRDEIANVAEGEAIQVVKSQVQAFNERRGRIDVGEDVGLVEQAGAAGSDRLELLTPDAEELADEGAGGAGSVAQLRRKLGAAKETSETLRQENTELRDRLDALSEQVEKMQRLIALKDQELAALSAKLGEEVDFSATEGQFDVEDEAAAEELAIEDEPEQKQAVKPREPKSFIDEVIDGKYTDYAIFGGGGLLVLLGVMWFMRRRMNEDEFDDALLAGDFDAEVSFSNDFGEMDDVETSIGEEIVEDDIEEMAADPVSEADVYIAYGKYQQAEELLRSAIAEDNSATDVHLKLFECFAEAKDQAKFQSHVNSVQDLIDADSEFERSIHGLFNQGWPDERLDTHTEALAPIEEELPSTDDIFGEVEDVGLDEFAAGDDNEFAIDDAAESPEPVSATIDSNPFDEGDDLTAELDDLDFDLDDEPVASTSNTAPAGPDMAETAVRPGVGDLGANTPAQGQQAAAASEDLPDLDQALDFDAGNDFSGDSFTADDINEAIDNSLDFDASSLEQSTDLDDDLGDLDDIDIDFEQDIVEQLGGDMDETSDDSVDAIASELDDDLDLNIDETLSASIADVDEASTKLDLARAYIDMGDSDGARDILKEVMSEGNSNQQNEARALLEKI